MGATLDLFIEWDDSEYEPFSKNIEGVIDFTKSIGITHCKPYNLMQAIVGIRGDSKVTPLIPPRGFPKNVSYHIKEHIEEYYGMDEEFAGWLHYSELLESLEHAKILINELDDSIQLVIDILGLISKRVGENRTRLIFVINT